MAPEPSSTPHADRQKARIRTWPWLAMRKGPPSEDDRPPVTTFPGKPAKVHIAQLTLTQADGYRPES